MIAKLIIRTNFMLVPGSAKHLLSDKQSGPIRARAASSPIYLRQEESLIRPREESAPKIRPTVGLGAITTTSIETFSWQHLWEETFADEPKLNARKVYWLLFVGQCSNCGSTPYFMQVASLAILLLWKRWTPNLLAK
jgi:hypothetical protein